MQKNLNVAVKGSRKSIGLTAQNLHHTRSVLCNGRVRTYTSTLHERRGGIRPPVGSAPTCRGRDSNVGEQTEFANSVRAPENVGTSWRTESKSR